MMQLGFGLICLSALFAVLGTWVYPEYGWILGYSSFACLIVAGILYVVGYKKP